MPQFSAPSTIRPPAGAELAAVLAGTDVGGLDYDALLDVAAGWERLRSWAEAAQNEVLVALDHAAAVEASPDPGWQHRWHSDQVALALGIGSGAARWSRSTVGFAGRPTSGADLIEAKGDVERDQIRMAVGQLLD